METVTKPTQGLILEALAAIEAEIKPVDKLNKNLSQGFMYRSIYDLYSALQPLMAKHKVVCLPTVLDIQRETITAQKIKEKTGQEYSQVTTHTIVKVNYKFTTTDGSYAEVTLFGEGMDTGDKSLGKAMSHAQKYAFTQIFAIPTQVVDDPDPESYRKLVPTSQERPKDTPPQVNPNALAPKGTVIKVLDRLDKLGFSIDRSLDQIDRQDVSQITNKDLDTLIEWGRSIKQSMDGALKK